MTRDSLARMKNLTPRLSSALITASLLVASTATLALVTSCSTAPSAQDRASFIKDALETRALFIKETSGLEKQLSESAGYAVFPGVGQWGVIFGGSEFGRAVVYTPAGVQEGWAAISNPSVGLQLGGQALQMLIVFQTKAVFEEFKTNVLTGSAGGTVVGGEGGTSATAAYSNGVAIYVTGQKGLMAGASVGLQYIRYSVLADAPVN